MSRFVALVAVFATILLGTAMAHQHPHQNELHVTRDGAKKARGGETLYYVFALQKCNSSAPWTIHGLWPQYSNDNWPSYCTNTPFDKSLIDDLWSEILAYWDTCSWSGKSESEFLGHEWTKHGTCSAWDEHGYFSQALNLYTGDSWKSQCDNQLKEKMKKATAEGRTFSFSDSECKVAYHNLTMVPRR